MFLLAESSHSPVLHRRCGGIIYTALRIGGLQVKQTALFQMFDHKNNTSSFDAFATNQHARLVLLLAEFSHAPVGKQRMHPPRRPSGIFYTANSGIWQTVWLEPVNPVLGHQIYLDADQDHLVLERPTSLCCLSSFASSVLGCMRLLSFACSVLTCSHLLSCCRGTESSEAS